MRRTVGLHFRTILSISNEINDHGSISITSGHVLAGGTCLEQSGWSSSTWELARGGSYQVFSFTLHSTLGLSFFLFSPFLSLHSPVECTRHAARCTQSENTHQFTSQCPASNAIFIRKRYILSLCLFLHTFCSASSVRTTACSDCHRG